MSKHKQTYNPRSLKGRRSYTYKEIANYFGIHERTVQSWRKHGLNVIDENSRPFLVLGEDVRAFLKNRKFDKKVNLGPDEFYCLKCKGSRKSFPDKLSIDVTGRNLGKNSKQIIIRGVCSICETSLHLFTSDKKMKKFENPELLFQEHNEGLNGNVFHSLNTDIKGG